MSLLNMSLSGGVFILAVLILRAVFQNLVPRRTFLILWLAACALLLIPARLPLPISIYSLLRRPAAAVQTASHAAGAVSQIASVRGLPWWKIVWLVGGIVLLAVVLIAHGRNLWRFRKAVPVEPHPADVPQRIRVRSLPGLSSPLVYGIIHPTILIPGENCVPPDHLRHIYLHELCHIRHLDVARRYLMLLVLAVHWFNPLVWIMYLVASQDIEMRCDEQVIRQLGAKKPYAATLVAMETGKLQHLLDAGFSFSSTGSRLKAIIKAKRLPVVSIALALILCVSALAVFATEAAGQAPASPEAITVQPEIQTVSEPAPAPEPEPESEPELVPEPEPEPEPEPAPDPADTEEELPPASTPEPAATVTRPTQQTAAPPQTSKPDQSVQNQPEADLPSDQPEVNLPPAVPETETDPVFVPIGTLDTAPPETTYESPEP